MDFLDEVLITTRSGDGGHGCVSFRRERFIPKGGPDGGDGGDGGDILIRADASLYTLSEYSARRRFKARNGEPGRGRNQSGKRGADLILHVPLGTLVKDEDTGEVLADLTRHHQEVLLIPGGRRGKGNQHFATPTRQTPRIATKGRPGIEKRLRLSLSFIADVGLVGLPNSGKSTLLSRLTCATPKIADYPFTTLFPNLGVMTSEEATCLILADIPGLVEGASKGRGLGHRFLRHVERTRLFLHIIDITHPCKDNILEDYQVVRQELVAYSPRLGAIPFMVVINKIDLRTPEHRDPEQLITAFKTIGIEAVAISALRGDGLELLREKMRGQGD